MRTPVDILALWPDRNSIWEDARAANPKLAPIAVYRWFQRDCIPSGYWSALLVGAARRDLALTAQDFVDAHAIKRVAA